MTDTANLGLPLIQAAQAQKHVTHNEALHRLDTLVQLAVLDRDLADPPGSPNEGERWIVAASPTGAWEGHADHVAAWCDGAWVFCAPQIGWVVFVVDEGALLVWNATAWVDALSTLTAIQNLARLGVGTTADETNPVAAKLNNALWTARTIAEGGDGDLRYKLSKEDASNTLSFLFQNDFSGRAEIGLTGDDDFHFKVSPDGSTWYEGIKIDHATGKVSFPASGGPRETLTANRTYYVRTDGNDSNDGLANTTGGAFLTIQKAIDVAVALDLSIYSVTIQVADGTYTGAIALKSYIGVGPISIVGNTSTPANVLISVTGTNCVTAAGVRGAWQLSGLKLQANSAGYGGILATMGSRVSLLTQFEFGATGSNGIHMSAQSGASIFASNMAYTISGGAGVHFHTRTQGLIQSTGATVTLTGTPAFTIAFALALQSGGIIAVSNSYSGGATGMRYGASVNGWIDTNGSGASFLPGDSPGAVSTGGQYA